MVMPTQLPSSADNSWVMASLMLGNVLKLVFPAFFILSPNEYPFVVVYSRLADFTSSTRLALELVSPSHAT